MNYKSIILFIVLLITTGLFAQTITRVQELTDFSEQKRNEAILMRQIVEEYARQNNIEIRREFADGTIIELIKVVNGIPYFYKTENINAAATTNTDTLWSASGLAFNLSGNGYSALGEWDGGGILTTHQEFGSRVTQGDSPSGTSAHSTHVAGTMVANGVVAAAKGMAYQANLTAYDWDSDKAEMASEAAGGMEISNHSYGFITGWYDDGTRWHWYGNTAVDQNESYYFGFYDSEAADWDQIAWDAPYYLIVKSAGNDNNDPKPSMGVHSHNGGMANFNDDHYEDGFDNGYDLLRSAGVSKNVLTVAAVGDILNYIDATSVIIESYSSKGPTDDGRIKPDISANGSNLYSTIDASTTSYDYSSGTSMATPNASGTLALLQQHYQNLNDGASMLSSTLKGLAIHTASDAGDSKGPDYTFGWGLLNGLAAAKQINNDMLQNVIDELILSNGGTYTRAVTASGSEPLVVTIVWTDPAGTPVSPALDPTDPMLVNDLDLRISYDGSTYYPWKLDVSNPSAASTNNSENNVDNVEQVYIENPVSSGSYTITVDHDGSLSGGSQAFSILISGIDEYISVPASCSDIVSPNDGETNVALATSVSWLPVDDATSYDVYFGTDGGGASTPTNIENGTSYSSTSLETGLSASTTYYLQIVPRNNQGTASGCNTIWSFSTEAASQISNFPFSEDFENSFVIGSGNDWENATNDDADWSEDAGGTPSLDTGPGIDHTLGTSLGTYLYTEASDPNYPGKTFNLLTPLFDFSSLNNPHLEFWYNMFGVDMGDLYIDVFDNGSWHTNVYNLSGELSVDNTDWNPVVVDLSDYTNGSVQQIRFRGITGSSWYSDMAIDDITIRDEAFKTFEAGSTTPVTFANTGVTIEFTTPNSGEIVLEVIQSFEDPGTNGPLPGSVANVSPDMYWDVNLLSGTVDGTYNITLDLAGMGGISDYSTLYLLKRADAASTWTDEGSNNYIGSGSAVEFTGITSGFSQFAIGSDGDSGLPVELIAFTAAATPKGVSLKWNTASEMNNQGFNVYRKSERDTSWQEVTNFKEATELKGSGTTSTTSDYAYLDNDVLPRTRYYYKLADIDYSGILTFSDAVEVFTSDIVQTSVPDKFILNSAYPNPFNPQVFISYGLPEKTNVHITIFDITGKKVLTLVNKNLEAGWHKHRWDGKNILGQKVGSGVYFYNVHADKISITKKLILIK